MQKKKKYLVCIKNATPSLLGYQRVTAISRMNFYSIMRSSPSQFKNEVTLNVLNESKYLHLLDWLHILNGPLLCLFSTSLGHKGIIYNQYEHRPCEEL